MTEKKLEIDTVTLAAELTIAWLGNDNTRVQAENVPDFLRQMHAALRALAAPEAAESVTEAPVPAYTSAVTVRKSLADPDYIISMIDGKPYKMLRRHLSGHGLTPEQYRARFDLKDDYPMVAPNYSAARRNMARKIGLGRKTKAAAAESSKASPKQTRKTSLEATKAAQEHLGGGSDKT